MEPSAEENTDSVARQASSFGTAAAAYAEHRPGYAEAAVRWALSPVRDRHPLRVLGEFVFPMVTAVLRIARK